MLVKNDAFNRILRYPAIRARFGGRNSQRPIFTTESRFLTWHASLAAKITKTPPCGSYFISFHFKCQRHLGNEPFPISGGYAFFLYFCGCLPAVSDLPVVFAMFRQTCSPSRELLQLLSYLQIADFVRDFHLNPAIVVTTLTCHVKESCYCSFKCP